LGVGDAARATGDANSIAIVARMAKKAGRRIDGSGGRETDG
jgi:hypothetical protein